MAVTNTSEQTKRTTPLYAVVGVGDLVVKRIRQTPTVAQARANERLDAVLALPGQVRALPDKAQAGVQSVVDQASETYGDLAKRGEGLVARIRRQKSTQDLEKQAKSTVSQARGTATTAKKSAKATRTQAKSTATTARTSAEKAADDSVTSAKGTSTSARKAAQATTTRAKATTTSAQHTAGTAGKAASDAADKIGD